MDNQRIILIAALAMVLLLIWSNWQEEQRLKNLPPPPVATDAASDGTAAEVPAGSADDVPSVALPAGTSLSAPAVDSGDAVADAGQLITVTTDQFIAKIDRRGGNVVSVKLRNYAQSIDNPEPVELLNTTPGDYFIAQSGLVWGDNVSLNDKLFSAPQSEYVLAGGADTLTVPLSWSDPSGISITKTLTFRHDHFTIDVEHELQNGSDAVWQGSQYRQFQRTPPVDGQPSMLGGVYTYTGGVLSTQDENYQKIDFETIAERKSEQAQLQREIAALQAQPAGQRNDARLRQLQEELAALQVRVQKGWIAMIQHYFLGAWVPPEGEQNTFYTLAPGNQRYILGLQSSARRVEPGAAATFSSTLFVGPKIQDRLETLAENLDKTVDYGWLFFISKPLFILLKWIHSWVGNWGWAIIIITIMIKLVFYKLSETSYRSMANMRRLAPQMQKLKERFGDDRQRLNQAMMELYKKEKINPLGGCLPILVQIPVFIALYWMLIESVELRHAPWLGWIQDLSTKDPYYILPVLMGASMFIQQKLNPPPPDPIQAKIMMFLPLIFTFFFFLFPAGLVLYWVVNNVLSILQQWVITKRVEAAAAPAKA